MNKEVVKEINRLQAEKAELKCELKKLELNPPEIDVIDFDGSQHEKEIKAINKEIASLNNEISKLSPQLMGE